MSNATNNLTTTAHAALNLGKTYEGIRTPGAFEPPEGFDRWTDHHELRAHGWADAPASPWWGEECDPPPPEPCECGAEWTPEHECYVTRGEDRLAMMMG